jgi:hypothetical protein
MKLETALNHQKRALSAIESMIYAAKVSSITSAQFNEDSRDIFATVSHCPRWVQEYCQGYLDCERKRIQRESLIFGGFLNGVFYSTHSSRNDYYQKHGIEPLQWAEKNKAGELKDLGHYWSHNLKLWFK